MQVRAFERYIPLMHVAQILIREIWSLWQHFGSDLWHFLQKDTP